MATEAEWRAAYEAKVQDFARETRRTSVLCAVVRRLVETVNAEFKAHGYSQELTQDYWDKGFPPEEREELVTALRGFIFEGPTELGQQGSNAE